jgi:hypothetical protein
MAALACHHSPFLDFVHVDISYVASQAHKIVNVALHRDYSPGIVFIFSKGGSTSVMSMINTRNNSC